CTREGYDEDAMDYW
nr:immunoglobulin heavy chain junction region [Mus musculus]